MVACAFAIATLATASDPLPRRVLLGVRISNAGTLGVRVNQIFPNTTASASGLKLNDIILLLDGNTVDSVSTFLAYLKPKHAGEKVTARISRENKTLDLTFTLKEWPRERAEGIEFLYDHAVSKDAKLRTIISRPTKATDKLPAVLYIQGIDCASIDVPLTATNLTREFVYGLTRAGFAVMRCEKSGVGDSTGPDCNDRTLADEVNDFASAVKKLKSYDFVDSNQVFLFGHSAGGWVAPLVTYQQKVQGIVVYGTVVRPFAEYLVENHRRNRRLTSDLLPDEIEKQTVQMRKFLHLLLDEHQHPTYILKNHPELETISQRLFPNKQLRPYGVRNIAYFRDVNAKNMAFEWAAASTPTLALCGEYETRTSPFEHQYIAEIVNRENPGYGEWKVIPKLDHGFALHENHRAAAMNEFKGPFGKQVVTETVRWLNQQTQRTSKK